MGKVIKQNQLDSRGTSSFKWNRLASYRLAIANVVDDSKIIHRDS